MKYHASCKNADQNISRKIKLLAEFDIYCRYKWFAFENSHTRQSMQGPELLRRCDTVVGLPSTVKPVCNDHLYDKIYYLLFIL